MYIYKIYTYYTHSRLYIYMHILDIYYIYIVYIYCIYILSTLSLEPRNSTINKDTRTMSFLSARVTFENLPFGPQMKEVNLSCFERLLNWKYSVWTPYRQFKRFI